MDLNGQLDLDILYYLDLTMSPMTQRMAMAKVSEPQKNWILIVKFRYTQYTQSKKKKEEKRKTKICLSSADRSVVLALLSNRIIRTLARAHTSSEPRASHNERHTLVGS